MITRKAYMNGEVTHNEYYAQFCHQYIIDYVVNTFGAEKLKKAYSEDTNLNNIPLNRWDSLAFGLKMDSDLMRQIATANGSGGVSQSDLVCTLKCAARIAIGVN